MNYYQPIAAHNQSLIKPSDRDMIYYSELERFFSPDAFRSLSVKFVVDGTIRYRTGGREYTVSGGQYLLACKQSGVQVCFDAKQPVKSICIDVCPQSFAEVYAVVAGKDEAFDDYLAKHFNHPAFFESVNRMNGGEVDKKLQCLLNAVGTGAVEAVNKEWFLDLTEKIVYKEYGNHLALKNIRAARPATRHEILRRLQCGKEYMDSQFLTIEAIGEVAKHCFLSEYHFFRSFRQAFKVTPYQYLSGKRLDHAKGLLALPGKSVSEAALACRYPDAFAFSKAFKRRFGYAPSVWKKNKAAAI